MKVVREEAVTCGTFPGDQNDLCREMGIGCVRLPTVVETNGERSLSCSSKQKDAGKGTGQGDGPTVESRRRTDRLYDGKSETELTDEVLLKGLDGEGIGTAQPTDVDIRVIGGPV